MPRFHNVFNGAGDNLMLIIFFLLQILDPTYIVVVVVVVGHANLRER